MVRFHNGYTFMNVAVRAIFNAQEYDKLSVFPWVRDAEVFAYLLDKKVFHLSMPRNRRYTPIVVVDKEAVTAPLTGQRAAILRKVRYEGLSFHAISRLR